MTENKHAPLPIGKLSNELLAELLQTTPYGQNLSQTQNTLPSLHPNQVAGTAANEDHANPNPRPELITGPAIGEDCAILNFNGSWIAATTDPITGSDKEIGSLGIHISLNDLASAGAEPVAVLVTLLFPPGTTAENIRTIMADIHRTTAEMHVALAGGHTEVTNAVNRTVMNVTALGKTPPNGATKTSGAKAGDAILVTKAVGLEGTAILANEKSDELTRIFGDSFVSIAKGFIKELSVVKEGMVAAKHRVHAMHDITEGGILGALWEMCTASALGAQIIEAAIPVRPETEELCRHFHINPYRLISSGSMLMACKDGESMVKILEEAGVPASIIGYMAADGNPDITMVMKMENGSGMATQTLQEITAPGPDELFKVK